MKKSVKIILLIVVVAILGGALYFLNADSKENKNMVVLQLPEETVTQISFKTTYANREAVLLKDEAGVWKCEDVLVKDVFINDIFNSISPLRAKAEIEKPEDLSPYGLDNPKVAVKIKTTSGDFEILIGGYNNVDKAYYYMVSGNHNVFVTEEGSKLNYAFDYDTEAFIQGQKR